MALRRQPRMKRWWLMASVCVVFSGALLLGTGGEALRADEEKPSPVRALINMAPDTQSDVPLGARVLANVQSPARIGGWTLSEEDGMARLELTLTDGDGTAVWKMEHGRPTPMDARSEALSTPDPGVDQAFPVLPESWNDSPSLEPRERWAADSFCRRDDSMFRPLCARLETLFDQRPLMRLFGWYVALDYAPEFLDRCKQERRCSWKLNDKSPHIAYVIKTDDTETTYRFTVDADAGTITGTTERTRALLLVMGYEDARIEL